MGVGSHCPPTPRRCLAAQVRLIDSMELHPELLAPTMVLPTGSGGAGGLLRAAAEAGSLELLDELLDAGVSCFEADHNATTALHLAALGGHQKVYSRLVKVGVSPSTRRESLFATARALSAAVAPSACRPLWNPLPRASTRRPPANP